MCGIAGVINLRDGAPPGRALLGRMIARLDHRGPEERGAYRDHHVAIGQTRLSIIDLAGGAQPLANEDESIWIVFNGEIYNYVELAEELTAKGHRFRTRSDTEVIVHAYEEWGVDCCARFNGQWAYAIWDRPRRRVVLARDRLGVRPLYLAEVDGRVLFGSEVKALWADPALPRDLDREGLGQVFTFWGALSPRTVHRGVRMLRPGHRVIVADGAVGPQVPYWEPRYPAAAAGDGLPDVRPHAEALRAALGRAVKLRMLRADVPVGVYLSGGIDSSVIAALCRAEVGGALRTFSLRFKDAAFDEGRYQHLMAERLGTDHSEVVVGYDDVARVFPDVVWHAETPMLRTAPAPLFLLSGLVRESGYKVVLTGEGSDEMLAGYDIFREAAVRRFCARRPQSPHRPKLLGRLYPWLAEARSPVRSQAFAQAFFAKGHDRLGEPTYSHLPRWEAAAALWRIFSAETRAAIGAFDPVADLAATLPAGIRRWEALSQAQYLEVRTLLGEYLLGAQGDRMLMGHSVEGRFPFLDADVVELCNAMPPLVKLRVLDEKHVLKAAMRDEVPREILDRPKQPYRAPDAQSFVQEGAPEYVAELLAPATVARAGIFDPVAVDRLLAKCRRFSSVPPSNSDNMAFVGALSTMLLWHHAATRAAAAPDLTAPLRVDVDRVTGPAAAP
ncbi:MAG TPA: asparagine synthase (glutamine-hydrolyzing) [Polyangia bacterium]|jgi:asparagine synthase (glutamine-hydrolysing)